ncbi:hypothetical protein DMC30DRAFT_138457 [Rhodotorula diobovata]|uniref:DUF7923 domain-containing protein n=1 Tax=Rhodotorula diobovata TaxID=5288 RepID=A0A5C5FMR9_9BASI|nr:hypothetical protein DMC30DRAFT_138457 [Rhodotorula diobovata]
MMPDSFARPRSQAYQERIKAQEEAEKVLAKLDAQLAQLEAQASTGPRVESHKADVRPKSPPFVLAFVNGTVAPFSDALIQKGTAGGREASSLLRGQIEFDLSSLSTEGEVTVLCFLYYDRLQLVPSLERNRVISNPSTWRNFLEGFSRVTGNFVVDVANSIPAEQHVASILSKLGFIVNLQQVYLVGVRPEQGVRDLVERVPDPTGALAEHFVDQVMPKIELVRHLPHNQMGELANATIEFAGLFESSVAVPFADRTQASVSQSGPPPPPSTRRAGCVLETQPLAQAPLPRSGGGVGARPAQPRDSSRATSSRGGPKLKIDLHRGLLHQGAPQFISARAIERDLTLDSLALQSQPSASTTTSRRGDAQRGSVRARTITSSPKASCAGLVPLLRALQTLTSSAQGRGGRSPAFTGDYKKGGWCGGGG